jgi:hypothetical protein
LGSPASALNGTTSVTAEQIGDAIDSIQRLHAEAEPLTDVRPPTMQELTEIFGIVIEESAVNVNAANLMTEWLTLLLGNSSLKKFIRAEITPPIRGDRRDFYRAWAEHVKSQGVSAVFRYPSRELILEPMREALQAGRALSYENTAVTTEWVRPLAGGGWLYHFSIEGDESGNVKHTRIYRPDALERLLTDMQYLYDDNLKVVDWDQPLAEPLAEYDVAEEYTS